MTPYRTIGLIGALIALIGGNTNGYVFAADWPPPPPPDREQPNDGTRTDRGHSSHLEVLTRGPVHEAFAEPVPLQVQAGLTVSNQPPANIEEVPPADRPEGDHFVWVPGYWSWDADRNDFIWVSACWRAGPPNMYWVPGYWAKVIETHAVDRGGMDVRMGGFDFRVGGRARTVETAHWEWVSGFWASAESREIEYLPAPPAPVDIEPPGPPPAHDNMWVPGCWQWREDQYVRRPGYWLRQQPGWVWEPSHYRWTPRGYVFEAGHWDYSLDRRGVLFAPVYIPHSVYARAGFSYSPSIAIDVGVLSANLFAYPRYNHYYFGDYYDDDYLSVGIYPQFESERRRTWYDPIYTYNRWHYGRTDRRWEEHQRQEYDRRRSDESLRPARTYREMEAHAARMPKAHRRNVELARPFRTIVEHNESPLKFERINTDTRQKIGRQAADTHKFRDERVKWEAKESAKDIVPPRRVHLTQPERVKLPVQPPIEGRPARADHAEKGPPPRPIEEQRHTSWGRDRHDDHGPGRWERDDRDRHDEDRRDGDRR